MTPDTFTLNNQSLKDTRLAICDLQEEAEQITVGVLRETERRIAEWDAAQTADIAAAVNDETGKPRFSNAESRSAELAIRQTNSTERLGFEETRTSLQAQLTAIRSKIGRLTVEASFLSNDVQYAIHQNTATSGLRSILMEVAGAL